MSSPPALLSLATRSRAPHQLHPLSASPPTDHARSFPQRPRSVGRRRTKRPTVAAAHRPCTPTLGRTRACRCAPAHPSALDYYGPRGCDAPQRLARQPTPHHLIPLPGATRVGRRPHGSRLLSPPRGCRDASSRAGLRASAGTQERTNAMAAAARRR